MTTLDQMMPANPNYGTPFYRIEDLLKLQEIRKAFNALDPCTIEFEWKGKKVRPSPTFLNWWKLVGLNNTDMMGYFDEDLGIFHAIVDSTCSGPVDLGPNHQQFHSQVLSLVSAHEQQNLTAYATNPVRIDVSGFLAQHILSKPEFAGPLFKPAPRVPVDDRPLREVIGHLHESPVYARWLSFAYDDETMVVTYQAHVK